MTTINKAQKIMAGGLLEIGLLLASDLNQNTHKVPVLTDAEGNALAGFFIVGKNSKEYADEKTRQRMENIMRSANRQAPIDTKTEEGARIVSETVDRNELAMAQAVVVGWFGFGEEGADATFDRAVSSKLLEKFPLWAQLVNNGLENDGNFMKV